MAPSFFRRGVVHRHRRLILSLSIFIGFLFLAGLFFYGGWKIYSGTRVAEQVSQDAGLIDYIEARAQRDFRALACDILTLAKSLTNQAADGDELHPTAEAEEELVWLALTKENYDKVRIFDTGGNEILRVNQTAAGPVHVPEEELQQKSHRPFLQTALKLRLGEFYLSPLELNVDFGRAELPAKPVVRALAPIHDPVSGNLLGIASINKDARPLLEFMRDFFLRNGARFHVVAENGQWIASPGGEGEWGLDLGNGSIFPDRFPEVWEAAVKGPLMGEEIAGHIVVAGKIPIVPAAIPQAFEGERPASDFSGQRFQSHFYIIALGFAPTVAGALEDIPPEGFAIFAAVAAGLLLLSIFIARLLETRLVALAKMEEQAAFQQTVLETMMEALLVINEKGVVLSINKACQEVFGYTPKEIVGKKVNTLMNPTDRRQHDQYIHRYLTTGKGKIIGKPPREVRGHTKDGKRIDLELAVNTVVIGGKRVFVGSLRDVTKRKRALEQTLSELEHQAVFRQAILDTMVDGLIIGDQGGKIIATNRAALKIFEYGEEDLIGKNLTALMPEEYRPRHMKGFARYKKTGIPKILGKGVIEVEGLTSGGKRVDLEVAVNRALIGGKPVFVGSLRDVTKRKRALLQTFADLEQFAYVASHDLKAPLRAIDNLSQWIEEDLGPKLKGETRKNMDLLRGRVRRLEKLLDDILLYSRAGRIKGELAWIDVNDVVADVADLLGPPEGFQVTVTKKLPTVTAPKGALEQIFSNLISNAIKHHDKDRGTIQVSGKEIRGGWEFRVADDGPGIPEQYHERIFKMFQKLEGRDRSEGSGMGLAIVRKVITAQGGEIWIESPPGGRGTVIAFIWKRKQPKGRGSDDQKEGRVP